MTEKYEDLPPGSDKAVARGCTCPQMDNCGGEGWVVEGLRHWWIAQDCPIHGWTEEDNADSK